LAAIPARNSRAAVSTANLDVERARRGDRAAERRLYEAHAPSVRGYCLAFCRGDAATAEDLVQESFVAAFAALGELHDGAAFGGWLRVIARRRCLRWIEQQKREAAALSQLPRDEEAPEPSPGSRALAEAVLADCRDTTLKETAMRFYGDPPESTAQIAAAMGVNVSAVTTRLLRFRQWARAEAYRRLARELS